MSTLAGSPFSCGQFHVVTAWGDEAASGAPLSDNPSSLKITDSDNELILGSGDPDVRTYAYDLVNDGCWYLPFYDVYPINPYIMNVTTLSTIEEPMPDGSIPTMSEWGYVVIVLLLITLGMIIIRQRQKQKQ